MKSREDFDWVGLWYAVGRERGLNDMCTLARYDSMTGEVEKHFFSHEFMDGVGALGELLRTRGYDLPQLPATKHIRKPALLQRPLILWKALRAAGPNQVDWLDKDPTRIADPNAFNWITFSREETDRLNEKARLRGVGRNPMLLEMINQVILPVLTRGNLPGQWVFPVNMRGAVNKTRDSANHSTAIAIVADAATTAEEIHRQIRDSLKSGVHWAAWWLLNIGRLIGRRGVRWISQASEKKSHWYGTFSDMGEWPAQEIGCSARNNDEVWMACAPGTKNYPISIACLTWNGRLTITLKIHVSICADRTLPLKLLEQVKNRLLS